MWRVVLIWLVTARALVRGAVELWAPHNVNVALRDHVGGAMRGLDMRCINDTPYLAGCLMTDLYYDRKTEKFLFFGRTMDEASAGQRRSDAEVERHFDELMKFLDFARKTSNITMEWSPESPPHESETCRVSVPIHLRQEWRLGTNSIGHLLRDNYQALVTVPMQFGLTAASFSWTSWPRTTGPRTDELSHVQKAYNGWLSMHPPYKWQGLVTACASGQLGSGAAVPKSRRDIRYVHIERALASGAGSFWVDWGSKTRVCERAHWQAQRDHAYRLNGVQHTPVSKQTRMLIAILYKPASDKRRLLIDASVVRAVQQQYPKADVEVHDGMNEEPGAQLQWLSRTSILVTNIGSASFRLLYLPDGAQVITIGALEGKATGTDGKLHGLQYAPFSETDQCWVFLPHLGMLQYHVTSAKDISFYDTKFGAPGRDWEAVRIRNAHVHVRARILLPILQEAVMRLHEQQSALEVA